MEKAKKGTSFMKQAAILAVAGILVRFLGFIYRLPLTNMIGDVGNAIYGAGYYIYTFLLILSSAGLPAAISKMVSERIAVKQYRNAHKVFKVSLTISGALGFICMVLLFLFAKPIAALSGSPDSYYCILTLCPTLFIVAIMSAYRGYFQGMNTMVPTAISQIVEQIFNAFFSVYLAWLFLGFNVVEGEKNIILGAAGGTAGTGVGALAGLLIIMGSYFLIRPNLHTRMRREGVRNHAEGRKTVAKELMMTAFPIILGTAVFSITNLIDMTMVMTRLQAGGFSYQEAQELYGQLSGKFVPLTTLPVSITTAMATAAIPSIAASVKLHNKKEVKRKMNMCFRIGMVLSFPAATGIGVLGDPIIKMLYPQYQSGGLLLTFGAVSIVFLAVSQIVTGILQGIGKVGVPVIGALLGAITKVILNYYLIANPSINVIGAVLSTTGCYAVASIFNLILLTKITHVSPDLTGAIVKPFIGSAMMGVVCYGSYQLLFLSFHNNTIATLLSICISIGVYGGVMLLIRGIGKEDIAMLPAGNKINRILNRYGLL